MQIRNGTDIISRREGGTVQRSTRHQSGVSNLSHAELILLVQDGHSDTSNLLTHINVALQHTNNINGSTGRVHLGSHRNSLSSGTIQEGHIAHVRIALCNGQTLGLNLIGQRIANINAVNISKHANSVRISLGHNAKQGLSENSIVDALESRVIKSVQDVTGFGNIRHTRLGTTIGQNSLANFVVLGIIHSGVHRELRGKTSRTEITRHSRKTNFGQAIDNYLSVGIAGNAREITNLIHYVLLLSQSFQN